ncbi:MAG: CDP-alcohol phosphatidyltransferase family protein [Myxococcales bacterium]|nr:CDP-alcohol phosphatidyltransferase family protein [Myxococcales bacterium]
MIDEHDARPTEADTRRHRALIARPRWLRALEAAIAARVPVHPHVLSALKLFAVTPALLLVLHQPQPSMPPALGLFGLFALLDYLDGVVARGRDLESWFGRFFDRVTDYPLLIGVAAFCTDVVSPWLIAAKLALDALLLALFLLGRGSTQNRLRTAMSDVTLLALLLVSHGWVATLVTPHTVRHLLQVNVAFTTVVILYNLDVLQKRHIANLCHCGLRLAKRGGG